MDPAALERKHNEYTAMGFISYDFCYTMFGILASNHFYYLSTASLQLWDKVKYAHLRTSTLPFVFTTMPDAVVFSLNISPPSEPELEHPIDVHETSAV